jgi:hypothetical protein
MAGTDPGLIPYPLTLRKGRLIESLHSLLRMYWDREISYRIVPAEC